MVRRLVGFAFCHQNAHLEHHHGRIWPAVKRTDLVYFVFLASLAEPRHVSPTSSSQGTLLSASFPSTPSLGASPRGPDSGLPVGFPQTANITHPTQWVSLTAVQRKVILKIILSFVASSCRSSSSASAASLSHVWWCLVINVSIW